MVYLSKENQILISKKINEKGRKCEFDWRGKSRVFTTETRRKCIYLEISWQYSFQAYFWLDDSFLNLPFLGQNLLSRAFTSQFIYLTKFHVLSQIIQSQGVLIELYLPFIRINFKNIQTHLNQQYSCSIFLHRERIINTQKLIIKSQIYDFNPIQQMNELKIHSFKSFRSGVVHAILQTSWFLLHRKTLKMHTNLLVCWQFCKILTCE